MHLPPPFVYPQFATEPPALVRVVGRDEVQWNRPAFKAPPLNVMPPASAIAPFVTDLRRNDLLGRSR